MEKPAFKRTVVTAGVAAALSAGAVAFPVFAQSGGSSGTTTQGTTTTAPATPPAKADHEARHQEYREALAAELGISADKLEAAEKAAREKVFLAHLDEMVDAGRISEADAKELRAAAGAGTLSEKLAEQALERLKARLDAAVKSGEITQDQADTMYDNAKQRAADGDLGRGFGLGMGGPGGFGGRGGHHGPGGMGMGGYPGP